MKTINYDQLVALEPCWLDDPDKMRQLQEYAAQKSEWSALDILRLPDADVSAEDKLWVVLCSELIDDAVLHEFACRCAERALSWVGTPDPRSVAAIEAKRKWQRGEITDAELDVARGAAYAARIAVEDAECTAKAAACATQAAYAARPAAWHAACTAWAAACTVYAAQDDAGTAEWRAQVDLLVEMLDASKEEATDET